jgi:hypothetical protein
MDDIEAFMENYSRTKRQQLMGSARADNLFARGPSWEE